MLARTKLGDKRLGSKCRDAVVAGAGTWSTRRGGVGEYAARVASMSRRELSLKDLARVRPSPSAMTVREPENDTPDRVQPSGRQQVPGVWRAKFQELFVCLCFFWSSQASATTQVMCRVDEDISAPFSGVRTRCFQVS